MSKVDAALFAGTSIAAIVGAAVLISQDPDEEACKRVKGTYEDGRCDRTPGRIQAPSFTVPFLVITGLLVCVVAIGYTGMKSLAALVGGLLKGTTGILRTTMASHWRVANVALLVALLVFASLLLLRYQKSKRQRVAEAEQELAKARANVADLSNPSRIEERRTEAQLRVREAESHLEDVRDEKTDDFIGVTWQEWCLLLIPSVSLVAAGAYMANGGV